MHDLLAGRTEVAMRSTRWIFCERCGVQFHFVTASGAMITLSISVPRR
jgi:hypothetical protein